MQRGRSSISISDLVLAGYLTVGQELTIRGLNDLVARIGDGGRILVRDKSYGSPSTAANAVLETQSNGWVRWRANVGGQWVTLAHIRDKARIRRTGSGE